MTYLIGTDEAGYGPNLGPLVISATVWQVLDGSEDDLYRRLKSVISPKPTARGARRRKLAVADSKALYSPDRGLELLERGVLAMLAAMGREARTWRDVWEFIAPGMLDELDDEHWGQGFDRPLPFDDDAADAWQWSERVQSCFDEAGVRLVELRSTVVLPGRWNRLLEEHGNKAAALSHLTFELLCATLERFSTGPVSVVCDKHGGRNRYQGLLQPHVGQWLVEVYGESSRESLYRWGPEERRIEVRFRPRAESYLPTALASMVSKYLRELAMRAFNDFWCTRVPELKPTAGYPRDAHRFREEIREMQTSLGIEDAVLWRVR
jgi:hypothetical protein